MSYDDGNASPIAVFSLSAVGILFLCFLIAMGMWGCPKYSVYQQGMAGKAKLAEAEYSRKVAVCEAEAKLESASKLGEAEVIRAKAMANANQILGISLKQNHEYLMYLWIEAVKESKDKIVYVPTEGNLPILESTRFLEQFQQTQK